MPVNRHAVLYLATLVVMVPIDFLFLGIVAKGFFTSQVGDMLGEIRLAPAILFYAILCRGNPDFRQRYGGCDLAIDVALRRVVRLLLLRDVRIDVIIAAQALDLAGRDCRRGLGFVRDGGVRDIRFADCQPARAGLLNKKGTREHSPFRWRSVADYFGCGTIRM